MTDLEQLERHDIPFQGEMVSSTQNGVKILTAHGSKGLEFQTVFIPFCLQDKAWPKREMVNKIPLPHELLVGQEKSETRDGEKRLHDFDENRLFYVAATRAKDRLVFTAAPIKKEVFSRFLSEADLVSDEETKIEEEKTFISLLKMGEQPDPIKSTKDLLAGFTDHLSLNPTSLNTYLSCPRKFLYHNLLKVPQGKHLALIYGSAVHRALDKCYGRLKREGKLPPMEYFVQRFMETIEWEGVEQDIRQGCLHKLADARRWYQNELDGEPIVPLEMERQCMKRMKNGLTFVGRFDKIDPDERGGYVSVVDYKTGKPDEHVKEIDNTIDLAPKEWDEYLRQLVAYKMLYEAGYKKHTVTSGQLVFIDPVRTSVKKYGLVEGEFMTKKVKIDSQMVEAYEDLVNETWEKIQALEFDRLAEHDAKVCGFCPYEGVCWSKSGGSGLPNSHRSLNVIEKHEQLALKER
jgi:DNA helicase II / ATP-dependent DNA helicase PcrA